VVIISLYARSDVCAISIPVTSGGCGNSHTRPVRNGAPDKDFRLDCPPCEGFLKGDRRPQILRYEIDPATKTVMSQQRVADADPHWASSPYATPETPDEKKTHKRQMEMGEKQLAILQAWTAAKAAGIDVPSEALFMANHYLPGITQGTMICPSGHDAQPGAKFCAECGAGMNGHSEPPITEIPLDRLHVQTLRKKCRESGLTDKGTKDEMIMRLEGARQRI
jgi:hypothetical protein